MTSFGNGARTLRATSSVRRRGVHNNIRPAFTTEDGLARRLSILPTLPKVGGPARRQTKLRAPFFVERWL